MVPVVSSFFLRSDMFNFIYVSFLGWKHQNQKHVDWCRLSLIVTSNMSICIYFVYFRSCKVRPKHAQTSCYCSSTALGINFPDDYGGFKWLSMKQIWTIFWPKSAPVHKCLANNINYNVLTCFNIPCGWQDCVHRRPILPRLPRWSDWLQFLIATSRTVTCKVRKWAHSSTA